MSLSRSRPSHVAAGDAEHAVAGQVAFGVVQRLEVVEIEHGDTERAPRAPGPRELPLEVVLPAPPVGQSREQVGGGLGAEAARSARRPPTPWPPWCPSCRPKAPGPLPRGRSRGRWRSCRSARPGERRLPPREVVRRVDVDPHVEHRAEPGHAARCRRCGCRGDHARAEPHHGVDTPTPVCGRRAKRPAANGKPAATGRWPAAR